MDFNQPEELIQIENVITPIPRSTSRVSYPLERYGFLHNMQELHFHEKSIHVNDPTAYEKALYDKDSSR